MERDNEVLILGLGSGEVALGGNVVKCAVVGRLQ